MQLFGIDLTRQKKKEKENPLSVVPPSSEDGSTIITTAGGAANYYGLVLDMDSIVKNENDLIRRYREVAQYSDCDSAITDIVNEAIVTEDDKSIELNLDNLKVSDGIKKKITDEFEQVLRLFDFEEFGPDIFRQWYIDGRVYYQVLIDPANIKNGITELRKIDPRKIRKIKNVKKQRNEKGIDVVTSIDEFYIYNDKGISEQTSQGVKLSLDSVIYCPSGLIDPNSGMTLGHLHKAVKPTNQLKMVEDAVVIYRISRAPERRIFYVDVGNLPKLKAEQYVNEIMNKFRNKIVYDATTGETRNDRKHLSMMEDFWMPRREGGKGTEITTLPGGCFSMDTKVSLLDGRELSIKEIENEINLGKTLWTYSCDEFTGEVKPGLISWAGVTQKSAKVMKLTLDNGEEIICTPDHKFPLYGRGFVEAKDFAVGESLIPLYRKKDFIADHKKLDYEMVFNNNSKKWVYTHRMVRNNLQLPLEIYDQNFCDGYVVHHKDVNRHNNSPENLCLMSFKDHGLYHRSISFPPMMGTIAAKSKFKRERELNSDWYKERCDNSSINSKEFWDSLTDIEYKIQCEKIRVSVQSYIDSLNEEQRNVRAETSRNNAKKATYAFIEKLNSDEEFRKCISNIRKESWTDERRLEASTRQSLINKQLWSDEEFGAGRRSNHKQIQELVFDNYILCCIIDAIKGRTTHQVTKNDVVDLLNENQECLDRFLSLNKNKSVPNWKPEYGFTGTILTKCVTRFGGYDSWKDFRVKESLHNHRIVAIEYLEDEIEVGTLTIDNDELYHNHHTFALSCGVFTKNSNLSNIDDINYFQNKLFQALNVPLGRLQPTQGFSLGRSTEITREEVKFNKFVTRLRKKFANLITDALRIQLIAKGIIRDDEWFNIKQEIQYDFQKDNYFTELKENEVLMTRLAALQQIDLYVGKYYSIEWVAKNVLQLNDGDIKEIASQNKENPPPAPEDGQGAQ
ncbi:Intein N-terminal splicing region [uncultured Caudovirales phage]|uniref:Intein N-terminal splicing region n=1 Tax=uncultured Caudovirales phage TaxID=2100421 RepID=A0A6J5L088_9CAUD|nr:Intein N-terminal splicing region [uncultured Caudovirales phage]